MHTALIAAMIGGAVITAGWAAQNWAEEAALISQAKNSVESSLKDPKSAQYSEIQVAGDGADKKVCGLVNAKNSYGGYVGRQVFVYLSASQTSYIVKDETITEIQKNQSGNKYIEDSRKGYYKDFKGCALGLLFRAGA